MRKIIIYVFLFIIIIITFTTINYINTYFSQRTKLFIESKGVVYTQQFLQEAILENVVEEINISSLYYMKEDTNQNVDSILINTAQINKILGLVNRSLEQDINNISTEKNYSLFQCYTGGHYVNIRLLQSLNTTPEDNKTNN